MELKPQQERRSEDGGEAGSRGDNVSEAVENTLNSLSINTRVMREILQRVEANHRGRRSAATLILPATAWFSRQSESGSALGARGGDEDAAAPSEDGR